MFHNALSEQNQNSLQDQQCPQPNYNPLLLPKPLGSFQPSNPFQQQQQQHPQQQQATCLPYNWYGMQPPSIQEQIRNASSPIFILPGSSSSGGCSTPTYYPMLQPTCVPYPMPLPMFQPYPVMQMQPRESECRCGKTMAGGGCGTEVREHQSMDCYPQQQQLRQKSGESSDLWKDHQCRDTGDDLVCTRKNCPASIQLQAMVSQLLGIQGVIASSITRLLLRKIPGSNITDSIETIIERATRCIRQLSKDQLLRESKASKEVNGLLSTYLSSASSLPRLIPILTQAQLKSNVLKALVENLVSARLMEEDQERAEPPEQLDALLLELKSDDELRRLLASLRERECEQRVNLGFASCTSQRLIAQTRLANAQAKINQLLHEMERRRFDPSTANAQTQEISVCRQNFKSPDPFTDIRVSNSKRLLLKPHVGSPDTTYDKTCESQKSATPSEPSGSFVRVQRFPCSAKSSSSNDQKQSADAAPKKIPESPETDENQWPTCQCGNTCKPAETDDNDRVSTCQSNRSFECPENR